jgi:hypothetical protein
MDDAEYVKLVRNKRARRLQKETGMKYTTALREIEKQMAAEKESK